MPDTSLAVQGHITPMEMIQQAFQSAIASGAGLEVVDRILAQQREMIDYQDRTAFNAALQRIQEKLKPISKTGWNPDTKSKFATAEAIDNEIEKLLQHEHMTLSFEPEPHPLPEMVRIVGVLSLGAHSKRYPLDMPADGKGPKGGGIMSRTHATGSAITYAKRYLKNMIFNLRFKEKDDDGRAAGQTSSEMPIPEYDDWLMKIEAADTVQRLIDIHAAAHHAAVALGDKGAVRGFMDAKNARKENMR